MTPLRSVAAAAAAVVAVATLALPAQAQSTRERPRQTDANFNKMISESSVGLRLSNGDVEGMSGIKLIVDKRKDLKLTAEQEKQFRAANDSLKEANKAHFKTLDSLRTAIRPRAGVDPEVERIRTAMAREMVGGVVQAIRASYDDATKSAVAQLDESQKPKADDLLKKLNEESAEVLREKLGGRGGGRRG